MPRPTAIDAAARFRRRLEAEELAAAERMATIYAGIFRSVQDEIAALAEDIAQFDFPDREKIIKLARLGRILTQIEDQVTRFGGHVSNEITLAQRLAIEGASADAIELIEKSLPPGLPDSVLGSIRASFVTLPTEAIEAAAGLLAEDSPLSVALEANYGAAVRAKVEQEFLNGVGQGMNPRRIAILLNRNFVNALGNGLTWAMTTVRTAQIKSYQLANHATYQANPDLVPTWVWHSALDSRTCMSCINQHGSEHPITEPLNDHHNGRCAPLPKTITFQDLGIDIPERREPTPRGEDWFNAQPAAVQREMMGGAKYRAWQDGQFEFSDLSKPYDDTVYGELIREASLKDMLGGKAKDYYKGGPKGGPMTPTTPPAPALPRRLSEEERFTPEYFSRQVEHEAIVEVAESIREFGEGEADQLINESLDQLRLEEDMSAAALAFDLTPGRMTPQDWLTLSDDLEKETGRLLKFSTETRRKGAGEKLRGPADVIAQVGGQDQLIKRGAISAKEARAIAADLNRETKDRATVYLESRLLRLGYSSDDLAQLSTSPAPRLEQVRRLLAEVGLSKKQRGRIDKVPDGTRGRIVEGASDKQSLEALAAARQPRTAEGLDMWELYKEATRRGGIDDPPFVPDELWGSDDESVPDYILG
jgi:polyhydroxyalkanoate synthesis regulator phasin